MAGQIDWHSVHFSAEIRTVIEIKTAKKILVGLAVTGVLSGNHAGHRFHDFPSSEKRANLQFIPRHMPLRG